MLITDKENILLDTGFFGYLKFMKIAAFLVVVDRYETPPILPHPNNSHHRLTNMPVYYRAYDLVVAVLVSTFTVSALVTTGLLVACVNTSSFLELPDELPKK